MKTCEYCGQVLLDDRDCTCDGAVAERKKRSRIAEAQDIIKDMFKDDGESLIPAGTVDPLICSCPLIADGDVKKVIARISDGIRAAVKYGAGGKIEVERTDTSKIKDETLT